MAAEGSLVVGDLDLSKISDEELFERLTAHGAVVGPIVCTTRKTYERKLAVLMGANVTNYSFTEENTTRDEPEDDNDVAPTEAYINFASNGSSATRRRVTQLESRPMLDHDEEDEAYGEESVLDPSSPLYTPSPRRPLRSPDNSYSYSSRHQESYLSSPLPSGGYVFPASPTAAAAATRQPSKQDDSEEQAGGMGQLLFKVLLVLLILTMTYLFFVGRSEKDAFASLEHLAQTAVDALEKGKDGPADDSSPPKTGL